MLRREYLETEILAYADWNDSSGGAPHGALPWDVAGTAFQSRVWRYLLSISSEEAQSDQQLTRGIGQPTAVWAVARECATTRVASVILYHRVIWGGRRS